MDTDHAHPDDLAALRAAFPAGGPPLGWDAVRAFEAEHRIVLPEPYRSFVAEICDGSYTGPPDYGLEALDELPDDWGDGRAERVLAEPFPLTEAWIWEDDPGPEEELERVFTPIFDHGSIVLGTDGCGMYWHLIVTGPHRGHVWNITGEGASPFGAEFGHTTAGSGFAGWVRHWAAGKPWYDA
jgi:SMI1 / KNR4 family (SUKH-1)